MTAVTINLDDYLSEEEKKQICVDVFRDMAVSSIIKNPDRVFSNAAYHVVWKMIDDSFDGNVAKVIHDKAVDIIKDLSEFSVFRKADAWHNEQSLAHKYLNEAVKANRETLEQKVADHLSNVDRDWLTDAMSEMTREILERRLFGPREDE